MKSQTRPFRGRLLIRQANTLENRIQKLLRALNHLYGPQGFIQQVSQYEATILLASKQSSDQIVGLQRIFYKDASIDGSLSKEEQLQKLEHMEKCLAHCHIEGQVDQDLEKLIAAEMEERYAEYIREIKLKILKELDPNPENPETLKNLCRLEKMEYIRSQTSALELLRPKQLDELVGQREAIRSLIAKLSTPYPQHILLYGPPGVGKTSCTRLALEYVKTLGHAFFPRNAPFVEVDGTGLRWDPRDSTNPLLGSVHDPIYQGAKRELAEEGIPEPKLGLVSEAHGGILFIDEIGEMDVHLQNKLLKVMEDKRVYYQSSYYDPSDSRVPQYIKRIFNQGVPADFVLIGATTREPASISPAFRSRCLEIFFDPLSRQDIKKIIASSQKKLKVRINEILQETICDYCSDGRSANKLLVDAYGHSLYREPGQEPVVIQNQDIQRAIRESRLAPQILTRASQQGQTGRIFGVGVSGYLGSLLEIECVSFPAQHCNGNIHLNETAGSMVQDSVVNSATVFRQEFGYTLDAYDIHVNFVGGAKIEGPSAGAAIYLAIVSAVYHQEVHSDVAITGELSIQGRIKPVGDVRQKIIAAQEAGIRTILIPAQNRFDVPDLDDIRVVPIQHIREAYPYVFDRFVSISHWSDRLCQN